MQQKQDFPSFTDFITKVPLYQEFVKDQYDEDAIFQLEYLGGTVDCFCVECAAQSVFNVAKPTYRGYPDPCINYFFKPTLYCVRAKEHQIHLLFSLHNGVLRKVGQFPSIADLTEPGLRKYRKVLGTERYRELTRAVGLASHGVGIGAHVYLRRIFESLIENYHKVASKETSWDEAVFLKARMDERIEILSKYLPPFLVENRKLYSILSKGVHQLSEEECLKHFPVVKLGLEIILDEELDRQRRDQKIKGATNEISALQEKLKGTKT